MTQPFVWGAVTREHFVEDSQAMRRRVESYVPAAEADRQIKLGVGGLRDVEFTVQLLQLVHGRADESIRSPSTLTALAALAAGGYVGRSHAAQLAVCYRLMRALEHRIQLHRLRRTHLMPTAEPDLRRLARSVGMRAEGADGLLERWKTAKRDVRRLHEELFYRPLLPATAQLSTEEASLSPDEARARLAAIGYLDPAGAMRHIAALTEGLSRRAAIQRQLLPVMLGWFADGADPDGGLLAFRRLSDELGSTHWYLKLLRDSGTAAGRLARVLSTSRYVADALTRSPESVTWLADDADLAPRTYERLTAEADAILSRSDEPVKSVTALRGLRRRELARTAAADVTGTLTSTLASRSLSVAADIVLVGALRVAEWEARSHRGLDENPTRMLVVAMGRLGGREMGYSSDADVLFVHDPLPGADGVLAQEFALSVTTTLRTLLATVGPEPTLEVDADLRPEGRNGPMVRSFDSYAEYYDRWSSPWESQALLRARPVAGDRELGERFVSWWRRCATPRGRRPVRRARDQAHQGAGRVRAAASGCRARAAPQARPRRHLGRRVDRAAAPAPARARRAGPAHDRDARGARGGRVRRAPRPRGRARAGRVVASSRRDCGTPTCSGPVAAGRTPTCFRTTGRRWRVSRAWSGTPQVPAASSSRTICGPRDGPGPSWNGSSTADPSLTPRACDQRNCHAPTRHRAYATNRTPCRRAWQFRWSEREGADQSAVEDALDHGPSPSRSRR